MRETKFRGKRISDGKWIEGVPVPNSLGKRTYILGLIMSDKIAYSMNQLHEFCHEVYPESIVQHTGYMEFWENDICEDGSGNKFSIVWSSEFHAWAYCYYLGDGRTYPLSEFYRNWLPFKKVGNSIDNPEMLLEDEK